MGRYDLNRVEGKVLEMRSRDREPGGWARSAAKATKGGGSSQVEGRLRAHCRSLRYIRGVTRREAGMG